MGRTAKNENTDYTTPEASDAAAAARAEIGNRPRQSVKRLVEYVAILDETAPGKADELIAPDNLAAIREHVSEVENPVTVAVEKARQAQTDLAVKALTNEDPLNGYAGFAFDEEIFAEKTRVKTPRSTKSKVDKAKELISEISDEDAAALREMLAARGL